MKPSLLVICNYFGIRNPKFHIPLIRYVFAEQTVQYYLINLLNKNTDASDIIDYIQQHYILQLYIRLKIWHN